MNSFVQSMSVNDSGRNVLLTCSDRALKLYEIKFENIRQQRKVMFVRNEFQDVINRRKWLNACFLGLSPNTKIVELQN